MKQIKFISLSLLFLFGAIGNAQTFKIVKATSQKWSGGIAGRYGTNYFIEIETSQRTVTPDTVWINEVTYPLDFSRSNRMCKRTTDSATGKISYTITLAETHDDPHWRKPNTKKDTATEKTKPIRHFEGAAMISYTIKHKQHFFILKSFTALKALNYP